MVRTQYQNVNRTLVVKNKTARDVMDTECTTVLENASIDEAIGIIVSHGIKRLPVLDGQGRFKGLISRESLLRTGYGYETEIPTAQINNEHQ